ncbi:MAG: excisionase family DNA-binding protein [Phycisphaeraceae bacterium]
MAKMYYTLEEAAQKLGVDEDQVKAMAAEGKIQQFRDGSKLMFKRDQVDQAAGGASSTGSSMIPLSEESSSDTDAIDLKDETASPAQTRAGTQGGTGGVDVFESGELDSIDPAAQTQVTSSVDDDDSLALESVGSGSGLLDLTRESDDTSLGAAELLEEISSGSAPSDSAVGSPAVGSSGVFESAIAMEPGQSSAGMEQAAGMQAQPVPGGATMAVAYDAEADDPAGSGFGAGMLAGAMLTLIIGLIVIIGWIGGLQVPLARMMTESDMHLVMWSLGLLVISFALGVVGLVIGKAVAR